MRELIRAALRRIDRDPNGIPIKLYPFTSAPQPAPSAPPVARPRSSTMEQSCRVAGAPRTRLFHGRQGIKDDPALVVIDPRLSAGRPVIAGTGLATQIIAERYKLGESIGDLAHDYERPNEEIEEAIRCELAAAA